MAEPTIPEAPETVADALALLEADGYTADFNLVGSSTTCPRCGAVHVLDRAYVERQFRYEGTSDPGDEAVVFGLRCADCGARGVLVSAYGPDADPEVLAPLAEPPPA